MSVGKQRFIAWNKPGAERIYRHCLEYAALAQSLAAKFERCDAERAWMAGLLAPLGWLAICAAEPERIGQHLPAFVRSGYQGNWQHQAWGLDHAVLVRRLSRAWKLPAWLSAVIGHLGLPVDIATRLEADPVLFQTVQLAVALRQRDEIGLALPVGTLIEDLLRSLDLSGSEAERIIGESQGAGGAGWQSLAGAEEASSAGRPVAGSARGEQEIPRLRFGAQREESLAGASGSELQVQKMTALGELAAGAGHEINNPLAVISGQAQYIARQLEQAQSLIPEEPALEEYLATLQAGIERSLKTIRGQSQRIHNVLTGLMQFARPSTPQPAVVTVRELLREAIASVLDLAMVRKIRLSSQEVPDSWRVRVDPAQTRSALACLMRNAVEAAPADGEGWAKLRAEKEGDNQLRLLVEDNGPGISPQVQQHMFDPFYSGRSAGRGQGLGLPIAWRLARQQDGEVSYEGHSGGVTRFILKLPGLELGYSTPDTSGPAAAVIAHGQDLVGIRH